MRVLDLFSGVGGFSLGLERAGMTTVGFCEINKFCRSVLAKHWPEVPCHDDIRTREFIRGEADVITAGFPCQDISIAGKGAGLTGERSGLVWQVMRAVRLVRPAFVILENVAELLNRGMGTVLGALARRGYDAEWDCIPACAVGRDHIRDRIWILAYPACKRFEERQLPTVISAKELWLDPLHTCADGLRWPGTEPPVLRVDDGIPQRLDRIRALGNSLCPQIPEIIGRAIMEAHHE